MRFNHASYLVNSVGGQFQATIITTIFTAWTRRPNACWPITLTWFIRLQPARSNTSPSFSTIWARVFPFATYWCWLAHLSRLIHVLQSLYCKNNKTICRAHLLTSALSPYLQDTVQTLTLPTLMSCSISRTTAITSTTILCAKAA